MSENPIELFLFDSDPIFRLGLCNTLANIPDFVVTAQASTLEDLFDKLDSGLIPRVVIVGWTNKNIAESKKYPCAKVCTKIKKIYPQLIIVVLGSGLGTVEINKLKNLGINGYYPKGIGINILVVNLRRILQGQSGWDIEGIKVNTPPNLFNKGISKITRSGKKQIERDIEDITNYLQKNKISVLEKLVLEGRNRELKVARWLVNKISPENISLSVREQTNTIQPSPDKSQLSTTKPPLIAKISKNSSSAKVYNNLFEVIDRGLVNKTSYFLEIDILKPHKKKELLSILLEILGNKLLELDRDGDIPLQVERALENIWKQATIQFILNHYPQATNIEKRQLIKILESEYLIIKDNIFTQIYLSIELFSYLAWGTPLVVDNIQYRPESPEAIVRAINLLHNCLIHLANGVMQVILNNFSEADFQYQLYRDKYKNYREIARFRNEISWRYRKYKYWENPKNVFESSYRIFVLTNGRIKTTSIDYPRNNELSQLQGLPWLATIILETRDAISPRLRSIFSLVGSGFVFTLTEIVGKAIGLIGRGILQGFGKKE